MANFYAQYPAQASVANAALASATVAIGNGASTVTITYSTTLAAATSPIFSFLNTTDVSPIFLLGVVTAFSTTGATITLNAPTDSANYSVRYAAFGVV